MYRDIRQSICTHQHYISYIYINLVVWDCRIYWLHLCRGVRSPLPNKCPGYNTKPSDGEPLVLELWGMWSTPLLSLLPSLL